MTGPETGPLKLRRPTQGRQNFLLLSKYLCYSHPLPFAHAAPWASSAHSLLSPPSGSNWHHLHRTALDQQVTSSPSPRELSSSLLIMLPTYVCLYPTRMSALTKTMHGPRGPHSFIAWTGFSVLLGWEWKAKGKTRGNQVTNDFSLHSHSSRRL